VSGHLLLLVLAVPAGIVALFAIVFLKGAVERRRGRHGHDFGPTGFSRILRLLVTGRAGSAARRPPILTVAAVLVDGRGHTLLVRKRGSGVFIQPGGKREPGEAPEATLARELAEELGVAMVPGSARLLGEFEAEAVNEPGRRVRALAFQCAFEGEPRAQAEIEEVRWVPLEGPPGVPVAPLSARHILPAYRRAIGEGP
jgi:ADP-ribose pyrophosphatase YjhB (NUDIX family)